MDKIPHTLDAVMKMKAKGVTAIKVELEANLDRSYSDYSSEEECLTTIMYQIADSTETADEAIRETVYDEYHDDSAAIVDPLPWLSFIMFYNDGSVDSELTFTVKLDDINNIFKIEDVAKAFLGLSEDIGEGIGTSGAGMHMSLVFDKDARYPSRYPNGQNGLPTNRQLNNFKKAMVNHLPALYFLSSPDGTTRNLDYRRPNISLGFEDDTHNHSFNTSYKYSAINYNGGAMEFRTFDTCYQDLSVLYDYIQVMANSLKYLSDTYVGTRKGKNYRFGSMYANDINQLYVEVDHIDLLNAGLKALKPVYYTIKDLKRQRNFTKDKRYLNNLTKKLEQQAAIKYEEYKDRYEYTLIASYDELTGSYMKSIINETPIQQLRELDEDTLKARAALRASREVQARRSLMRQRVDYIREFISQSISRQRPEFSIIVSQ